MEVNGGTEFIVVGVAFIALLSVAYILLRTALAGRRGADMRDAGRSAVRDVVPVAGASVVGLLAFLVAMAVAMFVLVMSLFTLSLFFAPDAVGTVVGWIVVTGFALLLAFPLSAVVVVVRRNRRHRR
jgi:hypothetical protein